MKIPILVLTTALWFATASAQEQKPAAGDTAARPSKPKAAAKVDSADYYFKWGTALCDSARYQMAVLKFKKAVILRHNFPEAWTEWGVALSNLGRIDEEFAKYAEAIKIDSTYGEAYFNWGTTLAAQQRFKEATDMFKKGIAAAPKHPKNYEGLGKLQSQIGFCEEAVKNLEKTLQLNQANPWAFFWQSGCYARLKKKAESLAALQKAIQWGGDFYKMEAQKDGAFNSLWSDPDFKKIVGL